jgi:hypothetical protein
VIPDLYLKRSHTYVKAGDWHRASIEFRRSVKGFPDYAAIADLERWREIDQTADGRNFIDIKSFDDAVKDTVKIWTKQIKMPPGPFDDLIPANGAQDAAAPYSLQRAGG